MKLKQTLGLLLCIAMNSTLNGQVTVGSSQEPNKGALLDLKSETDGTSKKGLGLPRVKLTTLAAISDITGASGQESDHIGLIVYNTGEEARVTDRVCPGLHVWDGTAWQPLTAYPDPLEQKILQSVIDRNFEYLDPDSPTGWPADKEADRAAGNYALGNSKTSPVLDHEGNDYNTSRFYVGYKTRTATYATQRSYLCDAAATPSWVTGSTETETERIFTDGIWTTEHLRVTTFPHNNAPITKSAAGSATNPQYYIPGDQGTVTRTHGLHYNWAAAINMGTEPGQTPNPGGSIVQGGSANDDVRVRGLCPQGWHLPSDQEWTDLENGIILKTSTFSTTADIGSPLLSYDDTGWRGSHGEAMKTTTPINGRTPGGTSKPTAQGGFDGYISGYASSGLALGYGESTSFWTASNYYVRPFTRAIYYSNLQGRRDYFPNTMLFSVRCIKD